jgi:hypothetical protein
VEEKHSLEQKKADVTALSDHKCPECGGDISGLNASEAHAEDHWPESAAPHVLGSRPSSTLGADAARRKKLLLQHGEKVRAAAEVK